MYIYYKIYGHTLLIIKILQFNIIFERKTSSRANQIYFKVKINIAKENIERSAFSGFSVEVGNENLSPAPLFARFTFC